MVKKIVLTDPEKEAKNVAEFILFLILFVASMTIGIMVYIDWIGMIDLHPIQNQSNLSDNSCQ